MVAERQADREERWRGRTCDWSRFILWKICTEEKGSKRVLKRDSRRTIRQEASERVIQSVTKQEKPIGVDTDRWTVRHAVCTSASLGGWRSLAVCTWSMGVWKNPGQTGASRTSVPISVPMWRDWDLCHGGLLRNGTIIYSRQRQPSHYIPVSNTLPLKQLGSWCVCYLLPFHLTFPPEGL